MKRPERVKRKAMLLSQIQQQRLDLNAESRVWLQAVQPVDRGWRLLQHLRSAALIGSSVIALRGTRHPRFFIRWGKRALGAWSTWRLVRKTLLKHPAR